MNQHNFFKLLIIVLAIASASASADQANPKSTENSFLGVENANRAKINYMLNCQGCHGQNGSESLDGAVPAMHNAVGKFLGVSGGRDFLVQVPGSANAAISDADLAELLNWILQTQSSAQLPDNFQPFTTTEVRMLRKQPETDVIGTRAALVRRIEHSP